MSRPATADGPHSPGGFRDSWYGQRVGGLYGNSEYCEEEQVGKYQGNSRKGRSEARKHGESDILITRIELPVTDGLNIKNNPGKA